MRVVLIRHGESKAMIDRIVSGHDTCRGSVRARSRASGEAPRPVVADGRATRCDGGVHEHPAPSHRDGSRRSRPPGNRCLGCTRALRLVRAAPGRGRRTARSTSTTRGTACSTKTTIGSAFERRIRERRHVRRASREGDAASGRRARRRDGRDRVSRRRRQLRHRGARWRPVRETGSLRRQHLDHRARPRRGRPLVARPPQRRRPPRPRANVGAPWPLWGHGDPKFGVGQKRQRVGEPGKSASSSAKADCGRAIQSALSPKKSTV